VIRTLALAAVAAVSLSGCALLSSELRRRMAEAAGVTTTSEACVELLSGVLAGLTPALRAAVAALQVVGVRTHGEYAYALCRMPDRALAALPAQRDRDEWKLAAIRAQLLEGSFG